jgi:hypothetical protein
MKAIFRIMKSCTLYIVFGFFVTIFVTALSNNPEQFRFWNGEPATPEQRIIALFVLFLLVVVSGYGAFKRAQLDWKLWKRKQHQNQSNSERQPK